MEPLVGEGEDMPSKRRHIHSGEEGAQLLRGRRLPLRRLFTACTRGIGMPVSGRSGIWEGRDIAYSGGRKD